MRGHGRVDWLLNDWTKEIVSLSPGTEYCVSYLALRLICRYKSHLTSSLFPRKHRLYVVQGETWKLSHKRSPWGCRRFVVNRTARRAVVNSWERWEFVYEAFGAKIGEVINKHISLGIIKTVWWDGVRKEDRVQRTTNLRCCCLKRGCKPDRSMFGHFFVCETVISTLYDKVLADSEPINNICTFLWFWTLNSVTLNLKFVVGLIKMCSGPYRKTLHRRTRYWCNNVNGLRHVGPHQERNIVKMARIFVGALAFSTEVQLEKG